MCTEVAEAFESGEHVLIQAGTGTGKSLGYLAPAFAHVLSSPSSRVIVATATLALQTQLATKDVPVVIDAVEAATGRRPKAALLKGRSNYACLHRIRDGVVEDQQPGLIAAGELATALRAVDAAPDSVLGAEVLALREWAEEEAVSGGLADRDDAPSHTPAAWFQVSVPVRECLGATNCPYGTECFVELSRARAREADVIVTNHALLAIDALHGGTALPEHDLLVIDEAHELVSRVTGAASDELSPQQVERVARRALNWLSDGVGVDFLDAADTFRTALDLAELGRVTDAGSTVGMAVARIRQVARAALSDFKAAPTKGGVDAAKQQAQAVVQEVYDVAERMAGLNEYDVVWVAERERAGRWVVVAPLNVSGLVRESILPDVTAVFTSATLTIGGSFDAVARQLGLGGRSEDAPVWHGVDVGSPFDYSKQGILYVAKHLPPPSREGLSEDDAAGDRRARPGGGGPHPRVVRVVPERHGSGLARACGAAGAGGPLSGRRAAAGAHAPVHRGADDVVVRHAVVVAGRRRAGGDLPARAHRQDPVPASRRAAPRGQAGRRGGGRGQRLHAGGGDPCRAAARPGQRPARAAAHRPRRGGDPGPAPDDRAVRLVPARVDPAVLDDDRPGPGARGTEAPERGVVERAVLRNR